MPIYSCRGWLINTDERLLYRDKRVRKLTSRAFDVLDLLISRRGDAVSKDEILGTVWGGYIVEEGNLPVHIFRIRNQLRETPEAPFIETIPGLGYRFVAPIAEEEPTTWELLVHGKSYKDNLSKAHDGPNLIVLPFENLTGNNSLDVPLEILAERLINALSQSERFYVLARNLAFEIGAKPNEVVWDREHRGIEYVVSGRARRQGRQLRISYEISNAIRRTQIWGGAISGLEVLNEPAMDALAESVVFAVLSAIERKGSGTLSTEIECSRLLTIARQLMRRRDGSNMEAAAELLKKAISLDGGFLLGYAEIVECYILNFVSGYSTRTKVKAQIAPYLDEIVRNHGSSDLALTAIAAKLSFIDFDFEEAKKNLLRAIVLNPFNVRARRRLADTHLSLGEFEEAREQLDRIREIDPNSFRTLVFLGRSHYRLGRFDSALKFLFQALELEPHDFTVHLLIGACQFENGNTREATASVNRSIELHWHADAVQTLAFIDAASGFPGKAIAAADRLREQNRSVHLYGLARIYAAAGDVDRAFEFLEAAYEAGDPDLRGLVTDPRLVGLRNDPRFREFRERLGMSLPNNGSVPRIPSL